jgi:hypothetical protein
MRLTIIKNDGYVSIDWEGYLDINLSSLDESINAVQWYDTYGEVEIKDNRNRIIENREITNIDDYLFVVPLWQEKKDEAQEKKDEAIANENRTEVELPTP